MSGASGHLQHLYENRDLRFGEIKQVLTRAAEGRLEKVTEKLDGMNIVFSWDASDERLRVARSSGEIRSGGLGAQELAARFVGRENVKAAFDSAFKVLSDALSSLPDRTKLQLFGSDARTWYSAEVIYASDLNVINYDSNNIVFHETPSFDVTTAGIERFDDVTSATGILQSFIDRMQKAVTLKGWSVCGPSLVRLQKIADGSILRRALSELDAVMATARMSDNNTIHDYLREMMSGYVEVLNVPPRVAAAVVERCIGTQGAPTVMDIKKMLPKSMHEPMATFVRGSGDLIKDLVRPIERVIYNLSVEVLKGVSSTFVSSSDKEVARIRGTLSKAISTIESSDNKEAISVLSKEMARLGSVDNVSSPVEGIVFIYKNQAYKFTGSFAPTNQILALFKYGRKGIPKMSMER